MNVRISIKLIPFAQLSFEIGAPSLTREQEKPSEEPTTVLYIEPPTGGPQHFEVPYDHSNHYVVPPTTA